MTTYSDEFSKETLQSNSNAIGHINTVDNLSREADRELQEYHKLIEMFRQDLEAMKSKIISFNTEINDTTMPLIESLSRALEGGIISQKEENTSFQEQLTDLKKEKSLLSQMIVTTHKRSELLNEEVGHY